MTSEHDQNRDLQAELDAHGGHLPVHLLYVNTGERTKFSVPRTTTLHAVFQEAYKLLKEAQRAGDKYFCEGGLDLGPYLGLTLEELHRRKICTKRHYEIAGETGGAHGVLDPASQAALFQGDCRDGRGW
jgi:hypothetical protein